MGPGIRAVGRTLRLHAIPLRRRVTDATVERALAILAGDGAAERRQQLEGDLGRVSRELENLARAVAAVGGT